MLARKALAGTAGAPKVYVEDVFSTYLYTGNGYLSSNTQSINNAIDLANKGGLVWIKDRTTAYNHALFDTARGTNKRLISNSTAAQQTDTDTLTAFNSNGFTVGADLNGAGVNISGESEVSWTFRKQPKFFDVVTYTGTGSLQTVSHNLGSVPGCIIIKNLSDTDGWLVYHRSIGATKSLTLNSTGAAATDGNTYFNDTEPTSTVFTVKEGGKANQSGNNYVAYLFAHDAGGFGDAGSDNVITCGSYTGNGSTSGPIVTLGYEPQWLLIKRTSGGTGNWVLIDSMRGFVNSTTASPSDAYLVPNTTAAEQTWGDFTGTSNAAIPLATGFQIVTSTATLNNNTDTYIYIAIRRGPMKTPTTGTSVFQPTTYTGNNTYPRTLNTTITPDLSISRARFSTNTDPHDNYFVDRLRGGEPTLASNSTAAEDSPNGFFFDTQNGVRFVSVTSAKHNNSVDDYINLSFRRAPGFFDVVCYTGTGSATTVSHNLGVAPELMIVKRRGTSNAWAVYANNDNTDYLVLNTTAATVDDNTYWNDTSPTSSVFSVGTNNATNASGSTYVAYLFASVSGVSKVGTYTGNGSSVTVTTNFQPRFILVKRTDSTGDWIVSDSARGLVAGDDPYLELNTTDAEVTNEDWVDISSTSFTVNQTTNNANVNTGTYIYLAVS